MALPTASDNRFPKVIITEGSAPSSPASGDYKLYVDSSDHILKYKNSAGTVVSLGTGLTDPMTTRGDIVYRNSSNVTARLPIGSSGKVLSSDGTDVSWQTPSGGGATTSYLGYNTVGGTEETATVSRFIGKSFTPAATGVLLSMEVYTRETADGLNRWASALYEDNGGALGKILASSPSMQMAFTNNSTFGDGSTTSIARWISLPLNIKLTSGTTYWGGIFLQASSANFRMFYDGSGTDRRYDSGGDFLADGGRYTQTDTTRKYSIRFLYLS